MIKTEGIYYRDKTRSCGYYSKIDNLLYFRNFIDECFYIKNKKTELWTKDKCISHNFSPYKIDGKYIALAGLDDWKKDKKWRDISYDEFCVMYQDHFNKPYILDEKFYKEIKYKFDTTPTSKFCNGLYLFTSDNGIKWNLHSDEPVIRADHKGFNSSLEWKSSEFDSKICLMKRFNRYWIYLRNNVDIDRRTIQVSTSTDLINWSEFKTININYDVIFDNYYYCELFQYRRKIFGFFPYYNDFYCSIKFMMSDDGMNWEPVADFFKSYPFVIEHGKRKNRDHIVSGIEETENDFFFYVHHNYMGYDINHDVIIGKYSLSKKYLRDIM